MNRIRKLSLPPYTEDFYSQLFLHIERIFSKEIDDVTLIDTNGTHRYIFQLHFTDNSNYVLKRFRQQKVNTHQKADFIIGFVLQLIQESPVPAIPLLAHNRQGNQPADYYFRYQNQFFYLEEAHTDGIQKTRLAFTDEQKIAYGRLLGDIHVCAANRFSGTNHEYEYARGWVPLREIQVLKSADFIRRIEQMKLFSTDECDNIRHMVSFVFPQTPIVHLTQHVIMNDLNVGNIFFDTQGNICAVFDWDNVSYGCKIHDLMHPLTHTGAGYFSVKELRRDTLCFLKGYFDVHGTVLRRIDFEHIHHFNLVELLVHLLFALQEKQDKHTPSRLRIAYQNSWTQYRQLHKGLGVSFTQHKATLIQRITDALST
jgi:Ser/Thr protein kinase RdoA (MazF antagonist)